MMPAGLQNVSGNKVLHDTLIRQFRATGFDEYPRTKKCRARIGHSLFPFVNAGAAGSGGLRWPMNVMFFIDIRTRASIL